MGTIKRHEGGGTAWMHDQCQTHPTGFFSLYRMRVSILLSPSFLFMLPLLFSFYSGSSLETSGDLLRARTGPWLYGEKIELDTTFV